VPFGIRDRLASANKSAIGKILLRGPNAEVKCEIIGLTGDVKSAGLTAAPPDEIYLPVRQFPWRLLVLLARTDGDPAALQPIIRSAVAGIDHTQPIASFATLDSLLANSLGTQRIAAWLTGVFAAVACCWRPSGFTRCSLTRSRNGRVRLVFAWRWERSGGRSWPKCCGRAPAGRDRLGLGPARGRQRGAFDPGAPLFRAPADPLIYGAVTMLFLVIAVFACLLPALRASRIDPIIALRAE